MMSLLSQGESQAKAGFLVVDDKRKMVGLNRKFVKLWSLPNEMLRSRDDDQALEFASKQFKEPERFLEDVIKVYQSRSFVIYDTIALNDGRIFERYSQPQLLENAIVGRLWRFRELV